jgi:hypothetical protein
MMEAHFVILVTLGNPVSPPSFCLAGEGGADLAPPTERKTCRI